jgi:hypothetical protein
MNGGAIRNATIKGTTMSRSNESETRTIKRQTIEYTRFKNRLAVALLTGTLEGPRQEPEPEYFEDDTPCPLGLYD